MLLKFKTEIFVNMEKPNHKTKKHYATVRKLFHARKIIR